MLTPRANRIRAAAEALHARFREAGAEPVEAPCLLPAETLLDLYGEDIRGRAYVTRDPVAGEMILRPDFTVPVVQMHMARGAQPARYTYMGPVWRRQQAGSARAAEYLQVGCELFDGEDPARADAEVLALFRDVLQDRGLRIATGDLGILRAAIAGLSTLERRKAALMRHLWRPARFRQLLDRYGGRTPPPPSRLALLERAETHDIDALIAEAGPPIGLRTPAEVAARIRALREDAAAPPLAAGEIAILETILSTAEKSDRALRRLRDCQREMPALGPALDRMEARLAALDARGIDPATLDFEGAYGRTSLEYYDGFVFGFYAAARPDWPVVASGGRYDALTGVLGGGRAIPAVGGVIRPELLLDLEGETGEGAA